MPTHSIEDDLSEQIKAIMLSTFSKKKSDIKEVTKQVTLDKNGQNKTVIYTITGNHVTSKGISLMDQTQIDEINRSLKVYDLQLITHRGGALGHTHYIVTPINAFKKVNVPQNENNNVKNNYLRPISPATFFDVSTLFFEFPKEEKTKEAFIEEDFSHRIGRLLEANYAETMIETETDEVKFIANSVVNKVIKQVVLDEVNNNQTVVYCISGYNNPIKQIEEISPARINKINMTLLNEGLELRRGEGAFSDYRYIVTPINAFKKVDVPQNENNNSNILNHSF